MDDVSKVTYISDKCRIADLEQMNQTYFVLVNQLNEQLEQMRKKLWHVEQLLQSVEHLDILKK